MYVMINSAENVGKVLLTSGEITRITVKEIQSEKEYTIEISTTYEKYMLSRRFKTSELAQNELDKFYRSLKLGYDAFWF